MSYDKTSSLPLPSFAKIYRKECGSTFVQSDLNNSQVDLTRLDVVDFLIYPKGGTNYMIGNGMFKDVLLYLFALCCLSIVFVVSVFAL